MNDGNEKKSKTSQEVEDLDELLESESSEEASVSTTELEALFDEAVPDFESSEKVLQEAEFTLLGAAGADGLRKERNSLSTLGSKLFAEKKQQVLLLGGVIGAFLFLIILIGTRLVVPGFSNPYDVNLHEYASKTTDYDPSENMVPLFDSFRSSAHTVAFPQAVFNLKAGEGGRPQFGKLEFFINLRDKKYEELLVKNQAEIMDRIQRIMEQITWEEMETPLGKEKVKKIIRNRLNKFFEKDIVLSVFYRSILLSK